MKIEHVAVWVRDLEKMKQFYETYFGAKASDMYHNQKTGFRSYFLSFDGEARLELQNKPELSVGSTTNYGYAHLAIKVGDKADVDTMAQTIQADGYAILNGPRTTGDGYYEAVVEDPEGNLIEITA